MIFKCLTLWSCNPGKEWVSFHLNPPSTCRCKGFNVPVLPARSSGSLAPSLAPSSVRVCLLQLRLWGRVGLLAFYLCAQSQCTGGFWGTVLPGYDWSLQFDFQDSQEPGLEKEQKRKGWPEHVCPHGSRLASLLESLRMLTCPYMDLFTMACLEHSALRLWFLEDSGKYIRFLKARILPLAAEPFILSFQ